MKLHDRTYAAFLLEEKLRQFKSPDALVLAVANGGVPLGYRISSLLHLPLQVIASRRIVHPTKKEVKIGAVCGDETVLSPYARNLSSDLIQREVHRAQQASKEYTQRYEEEGFSGSVTGKTVFLVDDGAVTGNTLSACLRCINRQLPARVIVAVPVLTNEARKKILPAVDEIVSLFTPNKLLFIAHYYNYFPQVSDHDVQKILFKAAENAVEPNMPLVDAV